jgi:hypothetical protein
VAAEQIRSVLRQCGAGKCHPTFTFDAGYDPVHLGMALAGLDVSALVRLRSGRCFYPDPPPGATGGRPRRHGSKFVCDNPTTWPSPPAEWSTTDAPYGGVRRKSRSGLHAIPPNHAKRATRQARPLVRGTLIPLEVERLPKPTKVPLPLWLGWWGPDPPDLQVIWRVYVARFSIQHPFRFLTQVRKLDDAQASFTGSRRSLDLVGDPGVCPPPPSSVSPQRSSSARAGAASGGEPDAGARATGLFATLPDAGASSVRAKTLWTLTRTTKRTAI